MTSCIDDRLLFLATPLWKAATCLSPQTAAKVSYPASGSQNTHKSIWMWTNNCHVLHLRRQRFPIVHLPSMQHRLLMQLVTFAGSGSNEAGSFTEVIVDLHISSKHNQGFDQLYVVHLSNKPLQMSYQTCVFLIVHFLCVWCVTGRIGLFAHPSQWLLVKNKN